MGRNQYIARKMTDAQYLEYWKAKCVVSPSGCWEWQGFRHPAQGSRQLPYAQASYRGRNMGLHRAVLQIKLGRPLAQGMHACHSCDVPYCINPDHIFEASNRDNQLDMIAKGRHTKQKRTHCLRYGHPLSGDNLRIRNDGRRVCKACETVKNRLKAGWMVEEALSTPIVRPGERTARRTFQHRRKVQPSTVSGERTT
jgi:hypothetical protein